MFNVSAAQQGGVKLEGAWIARTSAGPFAQWTYVFSPNDPSGRSAAVHGSIDVHFGPVTPGTSDSPLIGEAVQTGPNTAAFNVMWYEKRIQANGFEQITEIGTVTGTVRCIAPNKGEFTDHFKFYLPSADADGDGIPDPGSSPVQDFFITTVDTRVPVP